MLTEHNEIIRLWRDFNNDPQVREALLTEEERSELEEGTGAPEGRADFPFFMQTVIRTRMRERFKGVASKWRSYVGIENAQDFREHSVQQLNGIVGMTSVPENGEYKRMRSSEEPGPSFRVGKHGGIYSVTMELLVNDDADLILNRIPREIGRTSAEYLSKATVAFVESNPNYIDGNPFFGSAHTNEATGSPANPNETNLMAILDTIKTRRNSDGIPLGLEPRRILVRTPSQKATFDRIIRSQTTGVADSGVTNGNLNFGMFFTGNLNPAHNVLPPDAVIDEPWFNDPNDWYVLVDAEQRPAFVAAFLRNKQEPFIGIKDQGVRGLMGSGSDPYSWETDGVDYKVRQIFGLALGDPNAAFRARPS